MSLNFVVGRAADVLSGDFANAVETALRARFPSLDDSAGAEPYHSDPVDARAWPQLQQRAASLLGAAAVPSLLGVEAYQAVYVPAPLGAVENLLIPLAADPLQIAPLGALLSELRAFAAKASLPIDDVELMQLAAHYLEDDALFDKDLDVQLYVQLMLSARQAATRNQPLWLVR
ncbi:MAG TPA: hypothetical protein VEZ11_10160 [Thermoanaerobaculia bacterium]|nr:hypothetical protein [Thermoanaerobaculia bacterium]